MRKQLQKISIVVILSTTMLVGTLPARSQLVVYDPAANIQAILDYIEQLAQLVQLIESYQQMIVDFELQIENLEGYLDPEELRAILADAVGNYYGVSGLYDVFRNPPENLEGILALLAETYALPPSEDVLNGEYADIYSGESFARISTGVAQDWGKVERVTSTFETIAENRRIAEMRNQKINSYGDRIDSFGPNQEAEVAQATAAQINMMLHQMEQLLASVDGMLIRQENEERELIDARARSRQARLGAVINARNTNLDESDISDWYFE